MYGVDAAVPSDDEFHLDGGATAPVEDTAPTSGVVEYLVHYNGLAHYRDEWVEESKLMGLGNAERALNSYNSKRGRGNLDAAFQDAWCSVDRIVYLQPSPNLHEVLLYIKWQGCRCVHSALDLGMPV